MRVLSTCQTVSAKHDPCLLQCPGRTVRLGLQGSLNQVFLTSERRCVSVSRSWLLVEPCAWNLVLISRHRPAKEPTVDIHEWL